MSEYGESGEHELRAYLVEKAKSILRDDYIKNKEEIDEWVAKQHPGEVEDTLRVAQEVLNRNQPKDESQVKEQIRDGQQVSMIRDYVNHEIQRGIYSEEEYQRVRTIDARLLAALDDRYENGMMPLNMRTWVRDIYDSDRRVRVDDHPFKKEGDGHLLDKFEKALEDLEHDVQTFGGSSLDKPRLDTYRYKWLTEHDLNFRPVYGAQYNSDSSYAHSRP